MLHALLGAPLSILKIARFRLLDTKLNCTMQRCNPKFLGFVHFCGDFLIEHFGKVVILCEREADLETRHVGVASCDVEDKIGKHTRCPLVEEGESHLDGTKIRIRGKLNELTRMLNNRTMLDKPIPPPRTRVSQLGY